MSNQYSVSLHHHDGAALAATEASTGRRQDARYQDARHHEARRQETRRDSRRHQAHATPRKDYTLGHAGRQVRLGPVAFWIVVCVLVIMAGWSAVTATYFTFHDDLLTRLIGRQAEMQYAYEDRIAELRAQVDRVTSRQLLDQEQVEQRIETLRRRQAELEERAAALSGVSGTPAQPSKPASGGNGPVVLPDLQRHSMREAPKDSVSLASATSKPLSVTAALARLDASLDRVELGQLASLRAAESTYAEKAKRMRAVLSELGVDTGKLPGAAQKDVGGPFIPLRTQTHHDASPFEQQLRRLQLTRLDAERLTHSLVAVPVRRPLAGDPDTTSGFGVRYDPFLRTPALHSGLDFRGPIGEPVRATAAGTVTNAGWSGGYGRMVEIDHGNGFATRYGHMSEITVSEGQTVRIGQMVGRIGSTGRSTGPHLHYETRIDGEAVDPQKFLRAGLRLGDAL